VRLLGLGQRQVAVVVQLPVERVAVEALGLAGQVWRIGVMGDGARPEAQQRLLDALAVLL
jgi:aspartate aminotransferase-like enzyme